MRRAASVLLRVLMGAGLQFIVLIWAYYAIVGIDTLVNAYPAVRSARWENMVVALMVALVNAGYVLPPFALDVVIGVRERRPEARKTLGFLALGLIPSAAALAWLLTDDVQAGIRMNAEWVRAEFFSILGRVMLWDLVIVGVLIASVWIGSRLRSRGEPTPTLAAEHPLLS